MRATGVALLLCLAARASAVDYVPVTEAQTARCQAFPEERLRELCTGSFAVPSLKFPTEARELGFFTNTGEMSIFRPRGAGPFPAVILMHTCARPDFDPQHLRPWVARGLEAGYVVMVLDSWRQRGISEICRGGPDEKFIPIHILLRARDAYEALAHLNTLGFVDGQRVAAVGFSNGGRVAYIIDRASTAEAYSNGTLRFAATAAVYGQCYNRVVGATFLFADADRPLLSLLGELDEDGNPQDCLPRLEALKAKGAPVEWHVYPKTGHAWDQPINRNARQIQQAGQPGTVLFAYDPKVAEDSRDRVFEFLNRQLKRP